MFTLSTTTGNRDCQGFHRRDFLRIGTLGLAGVTLLDLLRAAEGNERKFLRDKSVVLVFLNGGPSQIETFDPKMEAPAEVRSMTGEAKTKISGVSIGGTFPKLAALADQLAIVRSFIPGNANHDGGVKVLSGNIVARPFWGAQYARMAGAGNPRTGMPNNVFLSPMSAGKQADPVGLNAGGNTGFAGAYNVGNLSSSFSPFHPTASAATAAPARAKGKAGPSPNPEGGLLSDMQLRLSVERLDDRETLLKQLDALRRGLDKDEELESVDKYRQQAYQVLISGLSKAFDLSKEDPKVLERYDTSRFKTPDSIANPLPQTKIHSPLALGRQMLLARRLVEAGCGFITVGCTGWDMHGNNGFGLLDGMEIMGNALDHAVAAFLTDLQERGLSEKVLLVMLGEMGRTPKIVNGPKPTVTLNGQTVQRKGRDHWANLGALLLAGGGLKMGQVVGTSDKQAGTPASDPVSLSNLTATLMHTLFDVGELRLLPGLPQDLLRPITDGEPIRQLMG